MIPKYRAWNKESKEMYACYGFNTFDAKNKLFICNKPNSSFKNGKLQTIHAVEVFADDYILMQSAGVKDKSDVEIYEGDIIKDQYGDTKVIQWHKGSFVITDMILDGHCRRFIYSHLDNRFNHHSKHEVLGNIYKNTGLLEIEVTEWK